MSARDTETSTTPSAKFLQARVVALSTTLIKRLENIFAASLEDTLAPGFDEANPPALTATAARQLQLDVESTALVRAAEELMILTRTMKELWLFGGLDTIPQEDGEGNHGTELKRKLDADETLLVQGFMEYLTKTGEDTADFASSITKMTNGGKE